MFDNLSDFWSGWVIALVIINYAVILFLFLWAPWVSIPQDEDGTTGHTWSHGAIREGINKLPKWWLAMGFLGFLSGFNYLYHYPGFGAHKGSLEWTAVKQMQGEIAEHNQQMTDVVKAIDETPVLALAKNEQAMRVGKRLFEDNCAACHGYDAKGIHLMGAPNLTDNTWLYGGKVADVIQTITNGRAGVMPAHKDTMSEETIQDVAHYVLSISNQAHDTEAAERGYKAFGTICFACHGGDAKGNPFLGAPNLTDNDWLYGSDLTTVANSIRYGRQGKMPAWSHRLNQQQIKVLAAWVLSHNNNEAALAAGDK